MIIGQWEIWNGAKKIGDSTIFLVLSGNWSFIGGHDFWKGGREAGQLNTGCGVKGQGIGG